MKKVIGISFLFFYFLAFSQVATSETFVRDVIETYKKHNSISYDIDYMMKFFDDEKPYYVNTSVICERIKNDTIFKGKFLYRKHDTITNYSKYYDAQFLYVIDHNKKEITRYDPKKGQLSPIKGNVDADVLNTYFIDVDRIEKRLKNTSILKEFTDSLSFIKVRFKYPDDGDWYGMETNIYFNKKTKVITKITDVCRYKDQIQKNQWMLSNVLFNKVKDCDFEKNAVEYFKTYKIEDYKPRAAEDNKLLENEKVAPELKGKVFPNYQDEITLKSDKIIVLDFWYTSCGPCIKAIPHLNQLKEKYKEQIEIVGVNPLENQEKDMERLNAFLKRIPMDYPILLMNEIPKEYNVRAYPTLYIIGKDKKVKYSKIGGSDNLYDELDSVLEKLLN